MRQCVLTDPRIRRRIAQRVVYQFAYASNTLSSRRRYATRIGLADGAEVGPTTVATPTPVRRVRDKAQRLPNKTDRHGRQTWNRPART